MFVKCTIYNEQSYTDVSVFVFITLTLYIFPVSQITATNSAVLAETTCVGTSERSSSSRSQPFLMYTQYNACVVWKEISQL